MDTIEFDDVLKNNALEAKKQEARDAGRLERLIDQDVRLARDRHSKWMRKPYTRRLQVDHGHACWQDYAMWVLQLAIDRAQRRRR